MSNGNLVLNEPEVIERFKKAVDRGVMKETREITATIKGYADSDKLDEAIKHYEELSKERYLYNQHNKDLYRWLKELRDRRKEEWL